jgi:hypothetical protein
VTPHPAHFKRMQERPSVKKLLAYEKEVNEGFAALSHQLKAISRKKFAPRTNRLRDQLRSQYEA